MARKYEVAQIHGVPENFSQVSYSHLISTVQTAKNWDHILKKLARTDDLSQMTPEHERRLKEKVQAVRTWLETHAPENLIFQLQLEHPNLEDVIFLPNQEKYLATLYSKLESLEGWNAEDIHSCIYVTSTEYEEINAKQMFKLIYQIFLGRSKGPRLGHLLASLEKDFVLDRVKHFSEA